MRDRTEEIFGPVICGYSRAHAIEDGVLVDMTEAVTPCPFKWPVAMTRAAYEATIACGGKWVPVENPTPEISERLVLPGGQDCAGRAHDVFQMLLATMRNPRLDARQRQNDDTSRVYFTVLVNVNGDGRMKAVELYSVAGPGDAGEPVITIMLRGED